MKTLGQIAYEAFCDSGAPQNEGWTVKRWEDLPSRTRSAWEAAGTAIIKDLMVDEIPEIRYVVGFIFSHDRQRVALIRKTKPAWQAGKLNGIGGKIEANESEVEAMVREFHEETGYVTLPEQWEHYLRMGGKLKGEGELGHYRVDFFVTVGDLDWLQSQDESIELHAIREISAREDLIDNVCWALFAALDALQPGGVEFLICHYP